MSILLAESDFEGDCTLDWSRDEVDEPELIFKMELHETPMDRFPLGCRGEIEGRACVFMVVQSTLMQTVCAEN